MKPAEKANWIVSVAGALPIVALFVTNAVPEIQKQFPELVSSPVFRAVVLFGALCGIAGNLLAAQVGKSHAEDVREETTGERKA